MASKRESIVTRVDDVTGKPLPDGKGAKVKLWLDSDSDNVTEVDLFASDELVKQLLKTGTTRPILRPKKKDAPAPEQGNGASD